MKATLVVLVSDEGKWAILCSVCYTCSFKSVVPRMYDLGHFGGGLGVSGWACAAENLSDMSYFMLCVMYLFI